jgi:hypothetical protein
MTINTHAAALGKKGGKVGGLARSPAKTAAARANGTAPCAPGKRRGRPRLKKPNAESRGGQP